MSRDEAAIQELRLKIALPAFGSRVMMLAGAWCLLWGTSVLVLRAAGGWSRPVMLWGAVGLAPALLVAGRMALRQRPSEAAARAALDRVNGCGGLLMAADETEIGEWRRHLPSLDVPGVRWNARRPAIVLLAGVAFVALGFTVPQRFVETMASRRLDVSRDVVRLSEQIETLADVKVIEAQQARALKEKLDQTAEGASGLDPVKTWEALDHLEDSLARTAAEAAEKAAAKAGSLAKGEVLAEALQEDGPALDPETLREALDELEKIADGAAQENEDLMRDLSPELAEALKGGQLSDAQLAEARKLLGQARGRLVEMAGKLEARGLIDARLAQRLQEAGGGGESADGGGMDDAAAELREFLSQNPGMSIDEAIARCQNPGRGGVDRGRGDAEMTWKDGTSEDGVKFKEQELPKAKLDAMKDSRLSAVSMGTPKVDEKAGGSRGGALKDAAAGGGAAFTHTILPRHQGAVKKYFEREDNLGAE